jgi:hypothetical protein
MLSVVASAWKAVRMLVGASCLAIGMSMFKTT